MAVMISDMSDTSTIKSDTQPAEGIRNLARVSDIAICDNRTMVDRDWLDTLIEAIERRVASGSSYRDLSLSAGLSHGYVSHMVKNRTRPSMDKARALAGLVGVDMETLLAPSRETAAQLKYDPTLMDRALAIAAKLEQRHAGVGGMTTDEFADLVDRTYRALTRDTPATTHDHPDEPEPA